MAGRSIDINCDLGESFGNWVAGNDEAVLPQITTASVACGFHAGDPVTMRETVTKAAELGVAIGAHPGLPDLMGFGRRVLEISPTEALSYIQYQVGALRGFLEPIGVRLNHVKPHGAFYYLLNNSKDLAGAATEAICAAMDEPTLYWPAGVEGRALVRTARAAGVRVVPEYFPDLGYLASGEHVVERRKAPLEPEVVVERVRRFLPSGAVATLDGGSIRLEAESICIHGDSPNVEAVVTGLVDLLNELGYRKAPATAAPIRPAASA